MISKKTIKNLEKIRDEQKTKKERDYVQEIINRTKLI